MVSRLEEDQMKLPLYKVLARTIDAYWRCKETGNADWEMIHLRRVSDLCKEHMPSGSGFDVGTKIVLLGDRKDRLIFETAFHHMDEHGGYNGWSEHDVYVVPDMAFDFDVKVSGRDRNGIKGYIGETFAECLRTLVDEHQA